MTFYKILDSATDNGRYENCIAKLLYESLNSVVLTVPVCRDGTFKEINFSKLLVKKVDPITDEQMMNQICAMKTEDNPFKVGDFATYDGSYFKVVDVDGPMVRCNCLTSVYTYNWGKAYRCDKLSKIDPCGSNVVDHDFVTGDPIFEEIKDDCATVYGFNETYEQVPVGIVLPMNERSSRLVHCEDCGTLFDAEDERFDDCVRSDGNIFVCEDCYERSWNTCTNCDCLIHEDDTYWHDGEPYCESCHYDMEDNEEEEGGTMHDYGYKPEPKFYALKDNGDTIAAYKPGTMYLGVELEIDNGRSVSSCLNDLGEIDSAEDYFYCKHDGSLNEGIEIVSHPCTLDYHLKKFPWSEIIEAAKNNGFKSHDVSTCGLHVHVSREGFGSNSDIQDLNIAKAIILTDRLWDEIVNFSRRNCNQLDRWAKKPDAKIYSYDTETSAVAKAKKSGSHDRYKAINLCNTNTVEFRLFRGTLVEGTLKATLQFVSNLVSYCKKASLADVQEASWEDVSRFVEYPELTEYLKQRNLFEVPKRPRPEEPKPVIVRFKEGDNLWFSTENTDNTDMRGTVNQVYTDEDGVEQPIYIVEDTRGYTNFLIDEEIYSNERIAELEADYQAQHATV